MTASPTPPFPVIPPYRITHLIHASDRTLVYRARRDPDQQPVILKLLRQQPPSLDDNLRLRNHYSLTHRLNLPGVTPPLGLEPYGQSLVLVSPDDGSLSLADFLYQSPARRLAWPDFLPIALQLSQILAGLHQHRIIHKDIKPANVLIQPETRQITLIDFGLASQLPQETQMLQMPGLLEGTLAYLSPEQTGRMNRGIDYRSDFYALGVTFYELLTGQLPFQSDDPLELVYFHLAQEPVPPHQVQLASQALPKIPESLSRIVLKLMAKNAEDRYQSALGLKADLEACLEQFAITGTVANFLPGQIDQISQFNIPQKLYGRESQIQTLLEAFERVSQGGCELVLVSGYSGIGKTALVNEILRQLTRYRGMFSAGKFDQFQRNIPLAAVMQAHRELIRQLLTESEASLQDWRDRFLQHLGANAQLIIEAIPELELIIGPQPPVPELGTLESANRLIRTFNQFAAACQRPEHPHVIFMDDLQWADLASLQSLQSFLESGEHNHFLVIAAYRDNEVSSTHPFMQTVETIRQIGTTVTEINLAPLGLTDLNQLVSETLHQDSDHVAPLANLLFAKTAGNPFFLTQLLKSLHEEALIWFGPSQRPQIRTSEWQWSLEQIQAREVTDNVVELMVTKIIKLPKPTQQLLQLAACIGNPFQLQTLAAVSQQSLRQTAQGLWEAVQAGLILPVGEGYRLAQLLHSEETTAQGQSLSCRFLHDRVQQAAYTLIPADQKQATHLAIGRLLLSHTTAAAQSEKIFEIVGHFNQGITLVTDAAKRHQLAQLNLIAGRKAKAATAYATAMQYLTMGWEWLPADRWQSQYDLTLEIAFTLAETAYLNTHFDHAETLIDEILQQAQVLLDRVKVYELKVQMYTAQNQLQQAVDTGLMMLELLQVPLADTPPVGLTIQDLYQLPAMTNVEKLIALKLLITIAAPAYNANPALVPRLTLTMIHLCVNYGNSAMAAYAYAFYGMLLCASPENIELGYEFGQLALWVLGQFESRDLQGKVHHLFNVGIRHWKEPARATLLPWQQTVQMNLDAGDIGYACYAAMGYCINLLLVGELLPTVYEQQSPYIHLIRELKQEFPLYGTTVWAELGLQLLSNAPGRTHLIGDLFNEATALPILQHTNNLQTLCALHLVKTMLHYWFSDYDSAAVQVALAIKHAEAMTGLLASAQLPFYESLVDLARYPQMSATEQTASLEKISLNQQRMQGWADHAPTNFQHKYDLVEAEKCRVLGNRAEAIDLYDRAIAGATANRYVQEAALANELAARFYLDWGKTRIAASYMQEAYEGYRSWGAQAKLASLKIRYPELLAPLLLTPPVVNQADLGLQPDHSLNMQFDAQLDAQFNAQFNAQIDAQLSTRLDAQPNPDLNADSDAQLDKQINEHFSLRLNQPSSTVTDTTTLLDLTTILRASQAISQEIQLERLLRALMRIMIENAAAQTGTLLLKLDEQWQIVAHCPDAASCQLQPISLASLEEPNQWLPLSVINYVQRTQSVILVGDPDIPNLFAADPYWLDHAPQTVLCLPILNQNKLIGILYLENYLTAGAFTRDRQEIVQLIAAQAAISLENAQLYSTLEQKVAERTQELSQTLLDLQTTQQELIQSEKMAALGQLTASVAHEINTPLGVIRGATSNIAAAFRATLQQLPLLMQQLTPPQQSQFLDLIDTALQSQQSLSTREERQLRRQLTAELAAQGIAEAEAVASQFVLLRIGIDTSPYALLLQDPQCLFIFEVAYHLILQYQNTWSIQHEVDRAAKIVFALKTYTHQTYAAEKTLANVIDGIEVVLTLYQHRLKQGVEVVRHYAEVPEILCAPDELIQVWVNLIDNAIYAMHQQGTLEISVFGQGGQIIVQITDSGPGISPEFQARIFEPFFTTKPQGEGSGLGLDIVRQIIQSHAGQIQVQSQPGQTRFQVQLPLNSATS